MSIGTGLFAEELYGETKVADDTGEIVSDENVFALEVSVCDGWFLGHPVDYSLVVEVSQSCVVEQVEKSFP